MIFNNKVKEGIQVPHNRIGHCYQIGNHGVARFTAFVLCQKIITGYIISRGYAILFF